MAYTYRSKVTKHYFLCLLFFGQLLEGFIQLHTVLCSEKYIFTIHDISGCDIKAILCKCLLITSTIRTGMLIIIKLNCYLRCSLHGYLFQVIIIYKRSSTIIISTVSCSVLIYHIYHFSGIALAIKHLE